MLLKPLPILLLIFCSKKDSTQQKCIFSAFIFCIVGDLCLMSGKVILFELGAGSFLFAHLLYIRAFCSDISWNLLIHGLRKQKIFRVISIAFLLSILVYNVYSLWDKSPCRLLFITYGVTMTTMATCAILRRDDHQELNESYWRFVIGGILFVISDSTIAALKFNGIQMNITDFFIMATYYSAQTLIFLGASCQKLRK